MGKEISATSSGVGNPVFIVGSATGKDGIHGASFASKDLDEDSSASLEVGVDIEGIRLLVLGVIVPNPWEEPLVFRVVVWNTCAMGRRCSRSYFLCR